jgi:hypothetical protein
MADEIAPSARGSQLTARRYRLTSADGTTVESDVAGTLGGNRTLRIYGRLDCPSARRALPRGYAQHRVFFADAVTAQAAGYRPCGACMRREYNVWKAAGIDVGGAARTSRA